MERLLSGPHVDDNHDGGSRVLRLHRGTRLDFCELLPDKTERIASQSTSAPRLDTFARILCRHGGFCDTCRHRRTKRGSCPSHCGSFGGLYAARELWSHTYNDRRRNQRSIEERLFREISGCNPDHLLLLQLYHETRFIKDCQWHSLRWAFLALLCAHSSRSVSCSKSHNLLKLWSCCQTRDLWLRSTEESSKSGIQTSLDQVLFRTFERRIYNYGLWLCCLDWLRHSGRFMWVHGTFLSLQKSIGRFGASLQSSLALLDLSTVRLRCIVFWDLFLRRWHQDQFSVQVAQQTFRLVSFPTWKLHWLFMLFWGLCSLLRWYVSWSTYLLMPISQYGQIAYRMFNYCMHSSLEMVSKFSVT